MGTVEKDVDVVWTTLSAVLFVEHVSVRNEGQEIGADCFGQDLWGDLYPLSLYCYEPNAQEFEALQKLLRPGAVVRVEDSAITLVGSQLMLPKVLPYEGDAGTFVQHISERLMQRRDCKGGEDVE